MCCSDGTCFESGSGDGGAATGTFSASFFGSLKELQLLYVVFAPPVLTIIGDGSP